MGPALDWPLMADLSHTWCNRLNFRSRPLLSARKRQRRGSAFNQESRAYMAPVAFLARKNLDNTNTVKSGVASANRA
jgi:hypothetical protein